MAILRPSGKTALQSREAAAAYSLGRKPQVSDKSSSRAPTGATAIGVTNRVPLLSPLSGLYSFVRSWFLGLTHQATRCRRSAAKGIVHPLLGLLFLTLTIHSANADEKDTQKQLNALIKAAVRGDVPAVQKLLKQKSLAKAKTARGMTAYHAAKITGNSHAAKILVDAGADAKAPMPSLADRIDEVIAPMFEGRKPAGVVLVSRDGKILFQKAYGYASLAHDVKATTKTKFRIGSVTKQFTAAAILKLQEAGKLKVTDKLSKFIKDFPRGDEVTLHHLLTHTSGIRSYTDKKDFLSTAKSYTRPDELIDSFKNDKYDFSPGEGWHYNNSGYFLLGRIVEIASGETFGTYLREQIFKPLGMNDTGLHRWHEILKHEATGYAYQFGMLKKAMNWDMSRAGGAGAIYSTVGDLHRWNEGLFGGKVINADSLKAATTPVVLKKGVNGLPYGYGLVMGEQRGLKKIEHDGGLHGFLSHLSRFPDQKTTVTVLVAASPPVPGIAPGSLVNMIAQQTLWKEMRSKSIHIVDKSVDPKIYDDYVGRYNYGSAVMTVTKEGKRLFAQLTGQPRHEIFPQSETVFFWKVVDAQVTFHKDKDGKVTHAHHEQGSAKFDAARLK